jgi:hypothetical protein
MEGLMNDELNKFFIESILIWKSDLINGKLMCEELSTFILFNKWIDAYKKVEMALVILGIFVLMSWEVI